MPHRDCTALKSMKYGDGIVIGNDIKITAGLLLRLFVDIKQCCYNAGLGWCP